MDEPTTLQAILKSNDLWSFTTTHPDERGVVSIIRRNNPARFAFFGNDSAINHVESVLEQFGYMYRTKINLGATEIQVYGRRLGQWA